MIAGGIGNIHAGAVRKHALATRSHRPSGGPGMHRHGRGAAWSMTAANAADLDP
jgi:hypothetical protein